MVRLLDPPTDQQLKNEYYKPAHCKTIKWRTGWKNGFVQEWEKTDKFPDEYFKCICKKGWDLGTTAGKRDAENKSPAYAYNRSGQKAEKVVTEFRAAWRLAWNKAYYKVHSEPDKTDGSGWVWGRRAARRLLKRKRAGTPPCT